METEFFENGNILLYLEEQNPASWSDMYKNLEIVKFFNRNLNNEFRLFATLCTVARLAPQFMEFSMQKYWSG